MHHLTLTGFYAGETLCGTPRNNEDTYTHAVYSPLHKQEFRAKCCKECLKVYLESYEEDEELPSWANELDN